ncbi:TIGR02300 family protein [Marivita sp.]|uniref:TIGR02300 family protein n=1 Tax=Marivita sp. TaxID=2003365 RepID=UPI0025C09873|nr:TIGR02300 family protein [Marivita sp.]
MPKEEWGVKRLCPTTGKRFYDLNNDPIISPYTGEVVEVATGKTRMIAADAEDRQTKTTAESSEKSEALEEDDVEVELADDVLEDDDDDNVSLDEIADVANEDND